MVCYNAFYSIEYIFSLYLDNFGLTPWHTIWLYTSWNAGLEFDYR